MSKNTLLEPSSLPHGVPAFDKINEDHYMPAVEAAIDEARRNINAIRDNDAEPTFENVIVAMETASELLSEVCGIFYNQLSFTTDDFMQELAEKIGAMSAAFSNDVAHDAALFAKVKTVYELRDTLDLTAEQMTLLEESYKGFVRGGALLDDKKKQRLREISDRFAVLSPGFSKNATKATDEYKLIIDDERRLSGIPKSDLETAAAEAKDDGHDGKWLFTLQAPSLIPVLKFADDRALREEIWRAYASRAWNDEYDNSDNVLEIVKLRHERANLLGYDTHAAYVLEKRMAEKPERVWSFLDKLKAAYKPAALEDLEKLKDFTGSDIDELKPWDVSYYSEKMRQNLFDFSSEDLRPYFPLGNVLDGVFAHFSQLFGLTFKKIDSLPVWHDDVQVFEVHNKDDGKFIGILYGDFYPRTGKRGGAWKTSYRDQGLMHGKINCPIISIVCNFPKPSGDTPSLLTHDDVTTLFHEMGHAVHALLSDVTYQSLSGTNVLWDFVELPSQLQENWAYTKETLDMFARHYQTGETIPETLIKKLNNAKNFMAGWNGLRQISLATIDMAWHAQDNKDVSDVAAFEDEATKDTSLFPRLAGPVSTSFGHIFAGGYSAGYYSYKWAEVLDADVFEAFLENGLYDNETAEKFKALVLSRGGTEHPNILYNRFRGRDADEEALLRREGLLAA